MNQNKFYNYVYSQQLSYLMEFNASFTCENILECYLNVS